MWLWRQIVAFNEYLKDIRAGYELDAQFMDTTGMPIYDATREEGHDFRMSGMTAHEWLSSHCVIKVRVSD